MEAVPYPAMILVSSSDFTTHFNGTLRARVRNQCSDACAETKGFVGHGAPLIPLTMCLQSRMVVTARLEPGGLVFLY